MCQRRGIINVITPCFADIRKTFVLHRPIKSHTHARCLRLYVKQCHSLIHSQILSTRVWTFSLARVLHCLSQMWQRLFQQLLHKCRIQCILNNFSLCVASLMACPTLADAIRSITRQNKFNSDILREVNIKILTENSLQLFKFLIFFTTNDLERGFSHSFFMVVFRPPPHTRTLA